MVIDVFSIMLVSLSVLCCCAGIFSCLVAVGNLSAMKLMAKNGVACFCGNIEKDSKLLNYVNKEGIGFISIPDVCYSPIMYDCNDKYKKHNFLQKPNYAGELYRTDKNVERLGIISDKGFVIKDLTIIMGSPEANGNGLRHANFSRLGASRVLANTDRYVEISENGVTRQFNVVGVIDKSIGELTKLNSRTRNEFLEDLCSHMESIRPVTIKNKCVVLLECKTDIDVVIVVLTEKGGKIL